MDLDSLAESEASELVCPRRGLSVRWREARTELRFLGVAGGVKGVEVALRGGSLPGSRERSCWIPRSALYEQRPSITEGEATHSGLKINEFARGAHQSERSGRSRDIDGN